MPIVSLLVGLLILCLIYWAIQKMLGAFGIGEPVATLVNLIFVILVVFWLLSLLGVGGLGHLQWR